MQVTSIYPEGGIAVFLELGYNVIRLEIGPNQYSYWVFSEFTPGDEKQGTPFHYLLGRDITQYLETLTSAQGTSNSRKQQIIQEMDRVPIRKCQLHHMHKWIQYLA